MNFPDFFFPTLSFYIPLILENQKEEEERKEAVSKEVSDACYVCAYWFDCWFDKSLFIKS